MKIKYQIQLDKYFAKPLAYLLNFLVRICGQILGIDHSLSKDFKTIAVCKFKGMGSIIQSTPMLSAIKKKYPNSELIYISTQSNKALLEHITIIDTVLCVNDANFISFISSNLKSLAFLIKKRPDVYFDLEIYADYSTLFTLFSLSINRVGFYLRSSSFRMGIYTHMMFFNPRIPISSVYLQLSKLIGCEDEPSLFPLSSNLDKFFDFDNYIVINPNASDLRSERKWGKKNYIDLINKIIQKYPTTHIILIGSPNEVNYTSYINEQLNNNRVINTAGKTTIDELIAIIKNARLIITNDTGPMHISFSTNTPTVCLFGPCSPQQYGISMYAKIIYKPVYCSPCVHDFEIAPCKGNNVCMKLIGVNEVFQIVDRTLANSTFASLDNTTEPIYSLGSLTLGKVIR